MNIFILLMAVLLAGCANNAALAKQFNPNVVYLARASGDNQSFMSSLYKIVINDANAVCKSKKYKYIKIVSLLDETGVAYDASYHMPIHFKRPQLNLSFRCVDYKKGRVILVK